MKFGMSTFQTLEHVLRNKRNERHAAMKVIERQVLAKTRSINFSSAFGDPVSPRRHGLSHQWSKAAPTPAALSQRCGVVCITIYLSHLRH